MAVLLARLRLAGKGLVHRKPSVAMIEREMIDTFTTLGIPADYGRKPHLPRHEEATQLEDVEINIVGRMQKLTPSTARDWRLMKQAAQREDILLLLVSGFRSIAYQSALIRAKIDAGQSIETILQVNAAPGFSQHHTGRAVDIATPGSRPLTDTFESTPAFIWLQAHAAQFHFNMPFTRDNRYGLAYEPWHWSQID
jgi:D-alanyl-D-alanine carboxypeptidase